MHSSKRQGLSLASIFLTFFIDNLSWSIVFPLFAPYFLESQVHVFSADVSLQTRTTILGFFLMAFSLGQFLGAPVIGEYADRNGRRKALLMSVFFTCFGFALTAWSMERDNLYLLFLGRLITGIFASNMSICLACVTDLSPDEKQKAKRFGYLSFLAGLSFILGAFVGGKISDPTISPLFTFTFPLWVATFFSLINFLFILFGFRETSPINSEVQFDFLECFRNLKEALQTEQIKRIYAIYFLFLFAWTMLFQFVPVLVVTKFDFTNSTIGDLALFMGICWAIGSGYLNKILVKRFLPLRVLEVSLILFTILCAVIIFPKHLYGTLGVLAGCVVLGGLAWPLCTSFISNVAPRNIQGKVLGISQSVQSLAMALAPALGGVVYQGYTGFPFLLGAFASLIAAGLYFTLKDHKKMGGE
ncbi:MAG: MFS transporter [Verrucomicrobiota bacterium]|nr:MFS transporter [Verrucomicrobiota bacterium]